MRETKFRAWDEEKKEMVFDDFVISSSGVVQREWEDIKNVLLKAYGEGSDYYFLDYTDYYAINNYRIMQYTGLYDKNGKEVYEGDILANGEVHGDNFYCVVEYQSDGFKGVTVPHRNHCRSLHNMMTDEGAEYNEVIGNIYENPELLDKLSSKDNEESNKDKEMD